MSDHRLPPRGRQAMCGHLSPTHLLHVVNNIDVRIATNGKNWKRTAQSAIHLPCLLPFVCLKLQTCHLRIFWLRMKRTIPISYENRPFGNIPTESHEKKRRTARMVMKTINIDANDRRTQKAEFKAVLRCRDVIDWACPDIAHYNYTLRFCSCGLSRGAGRCPVPLRTLP